jgi:hypothetical protein
MMRYNKERKNKKLVGWMPTSIKINVWVRAIA